MKTIERVIGQSELMVADIGYFFAFSNLFRWLNLALAFVLLYFQATPKMPTAITVAVFSSVFFYNSAMTLWSNQIALLLRKHRYLILLDVAFSFWLLVAYGWRSPFTVYSFSSVMVAGVIFRMGGIFLIAGATAAAYGLSVAINGFTWAEIVKMDAVDGHLFLYFDYFLIAIFFSYPAYLAQKLRDTAAKLREAQSEIKELTKAKERRRLAEDIHDSVAQSLYGINLMLDESRKYCQDDDLAKRLSLAKEASSRALGEIRTVIDDLFVENYADQTFKDIAKATLKNVETMSALKTSLSINGQEPVLKLAAKKSLCLILQEATSNVVKHANAKSLTVRADFTSDIIEISVIDDGNGFQSGTKNKGLGLNNMASRAEDLGGSCEIDAQKSGTSVVVTVSRAKVMSREEKPVATLGSDS